MSSKQGTALQPDLKLDLINFILAPNMVPFQRQSIASAACQCWYEVRILPLASDKEMQSFTLGSSASLPKVCSVMHIPGGSLAHFESLVPGNRLDVC